MQNGGEKSSESSSGSCVHPGASPTSLGDSVTSVPLATTTTPTAGGATATRLAPKPACVTRSRGSVTARSVPRCLHVVPFSLARLSCSAWGWQGLCVPGVPEGAELEKESACVPELQPACSMGWWVQSTLKNSYLLILPGCEGSFLGLSLGKMASLSPALYQSLLEVELSALLAPGSMAAEQLKQLLSCLLQPPCRAYKCFLQVNLMFDGCCTSKSVGGLLQHLPAPQHCALVTQPAIPLLH